MKNPKILHMQKNHSIESKKDYISKEAIMPVIESMTPSISSADDADSTPPHLPRKEKYRIRVDVGPSQPRQPVYNDSEDSKSPMFNKYRVEFKNGIVSKPHEYR